MSGGPTPPLRRPARVGLLTDTVSQPLDEDLEPLSEALQALGAEPVPLPWDGEAAAVEDIVRRLDLIVVRSPWEYHHHAERYLAAIDRFAATVPVLNPPDMLRWNVDKRYLDDLRDAGIAVVPTSFVPPGAELAPALDAVRVGTEGQFVVKPTVSAGSKNTARFRADQLGAAGELVEQLHLSGKTAMVQPYLGRVDDVGETALVHLDGVFSHGLRKGPLLRLDAGLVTGTFAPEEMAARRPDAVQRRLAEQVLAHVGDRFGGAPLYARVDLLDDGTGRPVVLEVELNEPSLFHLHAPGSAQRFAAAIVARLERPGR